MSARNRAWRLLLAASALLQFAGAAVHARGFVGVEPAIDASAMSPFLTSAYKALWLADSTNLLVAAAVLGLLAVRPALANSALIAVLAIAPLAAGALIYAYIGAFFAGHLMLAASVLALASAWLLRSMRSVEAPIVETT